jgi:cobalt-zinc-cadmium efflux system protein
VAAALISLSIILDGWRALKVAIAELIDGVPHDLEGGEREEDARAIETALQAMFPDARVLLRETGRYIRAEVVGAAAPRDFDLTKLEIEGLECMWRLDSIAFRP